MEIFDRFEEKIEELLEFSSVLKKENGQLKERIKTKEAELRELKEKLQSIEDEKGLVRKKVEVLITRLDGLIQNA